MMKRIVLFILVFLVACAPATQSSEVNIRQDADIPLAQSTQAGQRVIELQPGESVLIVAATQDVTPVPPTVTPIAPTETPVAGEPESMTIWHAPGSHGGLNPHEHGDKPPAWVQDFIADNLGRLGTDHLVYGGDESTPNENLFKHQGFKGFTTSFNNSRQYFRMHMLTNPQGQFGIFHSLEMYELDASGNVSFVQGWIDFAQGKALDPESATRNFFQSSSCDDFDDGAQPAGRPRVIVHCGPQDNPFESWYSDFHDVLPAMGNNHQDTYDAIGDPNDPSTWTSYGNLGLGRRVEATWNISGLPRGWFVADQFGRILSTNDECGSVVVAHGQEHTVICLPQYIAQTATKLGFPGNDVQKDFPGRDIVELPN